MSWELESIWSRAVVGGRPSSSLYITSNRNSVVVSPLRGVMVCPERAGGLLGTATQLSEELMSPHVSGPSKSLAAGHTSPSLVVNRYRSVPMVLGVPDVMPRKEKEMENSLTLG